MRDVYVTGIGLTDFGKHLDRTLGELAAEAVGAALADAALAPDQIDQVVSSNAAAGVLWGQEMIRGQVILKGTGLAGVPLINTENACASGTSAAYLAWLAVASGQVETALAVGVEKLFHPDKARSFAAIESGTDLSLDRTDAEADGGSVMMGAYAKEARHYAAEHGAVDEALARIAVKNRHHASLNPHAQFRVPITVEDVYASRLVAPPLHLLGCSPLTDGAAALVFQATPSAGTARPPVRLVDVKLGSYRPGGSVVARVSQALFASTGRNVDEIDVFQLHDASAFAELQQYEQVGIVSRGGAAEALASGRLGLGGDRPVNTDGGLLSRGHPLGATGLAQLAELTLQLEGRAGARQVADARTALAINSGGWMGDDYAAATAVLLASPR